MVRLLASTTLTLLANALALIVGAVVLPGMGLDVAGFLIAVVLFTLTAILIEPFLRQLALSKAPAILGSSALIATLVSLVVTAIVSDSLRISGATNWVLATVLVWGVALAARLLLPLVLFKRVLADASARRRAA